MKVQFQTDCRKKAKKTKTIQKSHKTLNFAFNIPDVGFLNVSSLRGKYSFNIFWMSVTLIVGVYSEIMATKKNTHQLLIIIL